MSTWINSGVRDKLTGDRIKTKAELRRLLVGAPQNVTFDLTSMTEVGRDLTGTEVAEILTRQDVKYNVVGPDPYRARKWYATVELDRNGRLKVS